MCGGELGAECGNRDGFHDFANLKEQMYMGLEGIVSCDWHVGVKFKTPLLRGHELGWSFRRSKSFGLFKLNFSKSGLGFSFGVPGARVGVNSKGKKYVRGGIPGTGLYYQSSLPDAQPGQAPKSTPNFSPLGILITLFVIGIIIYAMSFSTPTAKSIPLAPLPQVVAPIAAPVTPKHPVKHKRKHAVHRVPATATKVDENAAADSNQP